jgi:hypothetical protein
MIKVIYGEKGMGKTKVIVDSANRLAEESTGDVVFLDYSDRLVHSLKRRIRFINVSDYPVESQDALLGFVCGIFSQNYDIEGIFIDGLNHILKKEASEMEELFKKLSDFSDKNELSIFITISGRNEDMPGFLKEHIVDINLV